MNSTFRGPCIVIYPYNKTNQMHLFHKFILGIELYMFRTVPLPSIRSLALYTAMGIGHRGYADCLLTGSGRNSYIERNSYNKTNEMHQFLKFILGIELCMFRTVPLSIIRSLVLYIQ